LQTRSGVLVSILLLGCGCGFSHPAYASRARYSLQSREQNGSVVLRLYANKTKTLVWKRTFQYVYDPYWSTDRKCLALAVRAERMEGHFALLTWRAGEQPHLWKTQSFFWENDGILKMQWSPDTKRLLLLVWAGGGSLEGRVGEINILPLATGQFRYSGIRGVRRMQWIDNDTVRYWKTGNKLDANNIPVTSRKSHIWRIR
jgi:hypothetical protein